MKRLLFVVGILLAGCTARQPKVRVIIPRTCIIDIHLTDKTRCVQDDKGIWHCDPLMLDKTPGCEQVQVVK